MTVTAIVDARLDMFLVTHNAQECSGYRGYTVVADGRFAVCSQIPSPLSGLLQHYNIQR